MLHSTHTRTKATAAAARMGRQPRGSMTRQKIRHSEQPRLRAALPYSRSQILQGRRAPSATGGSAAIVPASGAGLPWKYRAKKEPRQNHHGRGKQNARSPSAALRARNSRVARLVSQPKAQYQCARRREAGDLKTKPHRRPMEGHGTFNYNCRIRALKCLRKGGASTISIPRMLALRSLTSRIASTT